MSAKVVVQVDTLVVVDTYHAVLVAPLVQMLDSDVEAHHSVLMAADVVSEPVSTVVSVPSEQALEASLELELAQLR